MVRIFSDSLLALFLFAGPVVAQQRGQPPAPPPANTNANFTITGQILTDATRDEGRRPVYLERDRQRIDTAFTDVQGRFQFFEVPPIGNYEIVVNLDNYEEERQRVDFLPNTRTAIVLIPLRRKPPASDPNSEPAGLVDVTELDRNVPRKAIEELERAERETAKKNTAKAVEHLQAALKIAPDFYRAHAALGRAYQTLKRYPEAQKEYLAARSLNSRTAQPLLDLGDLYLEQGGARIQEGPDVVLGLLKQAMTVLDEAIEMEPGSAMAHYLYGVAAYRSALYEEAETHLKRALELNSQMGGTRLMLANLYSRIENWDAALTQLDAYLSENPKAPNRAEVEQARAKMEANRNRPKN